MAFLHCKAPEKAGGKQAGRFSDLLFLSLRLHIHESKRYSDTMCEAVERVWAVSSGKKRAKVQGVELIGERLGSTWPILQKEVV